MNNYYIRSIKYPFKNKVCINCGAIGTQLHHVVPKELGGNDSTNCVWLCDKCHGLVHNISYGKNQLSHSELTKIGLQKARERGVQLGRRKGEALHSKKGDLARELMPKYLKTFGGTMTNDEFMKKFKFSNNTFYKYKKIIEKEIIDNK